MKKNVEDQQREKGSEDTAVAIRLMTVEDIPAITAIEEASFPNPWKAESFLSELKDNRIARYYCLVINDKVVGYMGVWLVAGEAHITNVAIWPGFRSKGWGEYLMRYVMQDLKKRGLVSITLEVRVSNIPAQKLYTKLGFKAAGVRRKYYSDNKEDAFIMWAKL
ncbi:MAG: ribosomal protein S18-alanine N-acetyltransferase [Peptococcaceae bacterium]|nr:ribosomal protein S18-alanine N-acetyltransferase [Peptococcaceae bacterium]